jgi:DNA-binding NtrC family response regulator
MRHHLAAVLERTGWNISRTAALLGVVRNTVYAHIEKFRLEPAPAARPAPPASGTAPPWSLAR